MLQHEQAHSQRKDEAIEVVANDREAEARGEPQVGPHTAPPAASFEQLTGQNEQHAVEAAPAKSAVRPQVDSTSVSDVFVEQVAHGMAYKEALDDADEKLLAENGYKPNPPIRGAHEFFMRTFTPTVGGKPPIVAFRGTVPSKVDTLLTDIDPSGIGMSQFNPNKAQIERQMQAMSAHGKVITTGHSLGGALAQIAAATFPGLVDRIVTFQSPGVSREMAQKIVEYNEQHPDQAIESSHHRVKNDLVPMGGQALAPGVIHNHEMVGGSRLSRNPLAAHLAYPLAQEAAAQGEQLPNTGAAHEMHPVGDVTTETDNAEKSQLIEHARTGMGHLVYGTGALIHGAGNLIHRAGEGIASMFE
jgi:hypothetical protein